MLDALAADTVLGDEDRLSLQEAVVVDKVVVEIDQAFASELALHLE